MYRRDLVKTILALSAWGLAAGRAAAQGQGQGQAPPRGEGVPFSFDWLKQEARRLAAQPYVPRPNALPPQLAALDWDAYQAIRFDPAHSLWRGRDLAFQVRLFHLGLYYTQPVRLYEVADGIARPIAYSPELFDSGPTRFEPPLPADLGFAGFRVFFQSDPDRDLAAFLGASYFRATSGEMQYGLSARGVAIDTGLPRPEEFPAFTAFWLERPAPEQTYLRVHALLDGPSIAGAYSVRIQPGWTVLMDVTAALYPRRPIERLGLAPLTSMYLYGENDRRAADDFRPEIHDSDGLALWTGAGEWIWRPLVNPAALRFNAFVDENPRGFGLLQRDRNFDHYQDDGVFYERRPSLWVEPVGAWGRGAVQLFEIPANEEIFDNIVAFWNPERPAAPGEELALTYRLYWCVEPPVRPPLARVVATRTGAGGVVGRPRPQPGDARKFVIDFAGGDLPMLADNAPVEPVITASRGTIEIPSARPLHEIRGWRAIFDLRPGDGTDPINLRCFLRLGGATLTETWLYQWTPPGN